MDRREKAELDRYITREPDRDDESPTLTEMLREVDPMADVRVGIYKEVFKDWLKTVGLPLITGFDKRGIHFDATESVRKLLITLVDEP